MPVQRVREMLFHNLVLCRYVVQCQSHRILSLLSVRHPHPFNKKPAYSGCVGSTIVCESVRASNQVFFGRKFPHAPNLFSSAALVPSPPP